MKIKVKPFVIAAGLSLLTLSTSAVDLLKQYPTELTAGDTNPDHAQPWHFKAEDIYHLSQFDLSVGDEFKVTLGSADLGVGHCTNGAVWAVLLPREQGTLTSPVSSTQEPIAQVWLRFHPTEIDRLFPPDTVTPNGDKSLEKKIQGLARARIGTSWQSDGKAMIPEPKDMTVFVDTKSGNHHRFFMVDTDAKTAEYVGAFDRHSGSGEISPTSIPPVVVKTVPESGATDVPPGETELKVTFSKPMMDGSWTWTTSWEDSTPETIGTPAFDSGGKTCVLKVKLEPNKTYGFWLNSERFRNFKDKQGRAAVPYLLVFKTASN